MDINLGDAVLSVELRIPGLEPPRPLELVWCVGPVSDSLPADRVVGPAPTYKCPPRKVDLTMILKVDKKVAFALKGRDEFGNVVPLPEGTTVTYVVDDPSLLALTDNGDGSGVIAATGTLGVATLTGTVTKADGTVSTAVESVQIVEGDAEAFVLEFGPEEEVTPDA